MNRRESLVTLAGSALGGVGATAGCASVAQSEDSRMVIDDGVTDITPVYVMTYTDGQPTVFVRANYYFFDAKKQVQLRVGGSIKVNGNLLKHDPQTLTSYIGNISMPSELLTFEFTRATGQVSRHSFALPKLEVVAYPTQYSGDGPVRVAVSPGAVRKGVMEDSYNMTIFGPTGESRFVGESEGQSQLRFRSVQMSALPTGSYRARVYRQQRTALKDISDYKTGWAVASHGHNFMIEVV